MRLDTSRTGYARLTPRQARFVIAAIVLSAAFFVGVSLSPLKSGYADAPSRGPGDVDLYRTYVERVRAGDGYYKILGEELRQRGYPTKSVFNWRTPYLHWTIGKLPHPLLGKALLIILSGTLLLTSFHVVEQEGSLYQAGGCGLLLTGALLPCVLGDLYVLPVVWAGILIGLSLTFYALDYRKTAILFGLAAPFARDLALPFCLLAAALALWRKRRIEALAWAVGIAVYVGLFLVHAWHVQGLIRPEDTAHDEGWIQFAGAAFVISTAQMNCYLLLLPQWITALYLVAAMIGLAGWQSEFGTRIGLTVCLFAVAFACVGQAFNQYWGALVAPLYCFGCVRIPASLADLLRSAGWTKLAPTRDAVAADV